ncbi:MAG: sigma-70 family RNA polymerase sigma factor [Pirellulaceae bacterium]|nr:sigma-70 family RNA polymerase sigma factor [Pirellulaceae bacterium]
MSSKSRSFSSSRMVARSRSFLADLYLRMRPALKAVARQQTQSVPNCKADESDIVQISIMKALERMDQFQGETTGQWRAWLVQIVRNQAKDVRRYNKQACRTYKNEERDSQAIVRLEDKSVLTPSKIIVAEEHQQILDTALSSLDIRQQQLIRWRMFQYATYKEIAKRLKVTEPTARNRCQVAREAFREALERLGA